MFPTVCHDPSRINTGRIDRPPVIWIEFGLRLRSPGDQGESPSLKPSLTEGVRGCAILRMPAVFHYDELRRIRGLGDLRCSASHQAATFNENAGTSNSGLCLLRLRHVVQRPHNAAILTPTANC